MDIIGQRFRAVETSVLEEGGWGVARHLEVVPETRVSSVTPGLRATVAAAERQSRRLRHDLWKRPRDSHWKPWIEYPNSRRSHSSAVKKQRRPPKEGRASRVSNDKGPRRGWLGDLIGGILPDDGLYVDRSRTRDGETLGK